MIFTIRGVNSLPVVYIIFSYEVFLNCCGYILDYVFNAFFSINLKEFNEILTLSTLLLLLLFISGILL